MAGGVKVLERPGAEGSYVRAASKGLGVTLKHMIRPYKVTQQYPDEKWELAPRLRGTHRMAVHEDGRAKCVGLRPLSDGLPRELHQADPRRG